MSDERRDEEADTKPLDAARLGGEPGADDQEERPSESQPGADGAAAARTQQPERLRRAPARRRTSTASQTREADEYQWHTGRTREHGSEDAVEFIDVVKAFGRNSVLNGLNLGLPDNQISMILGPSGTGKSVCIKHMVGLLYPGRGRRARARRVRAGHGRRGAVRDAQEVRRPVPGRRALRLDERVRQHGVPASPAHRQGRGRDPRDRGPAARRGRPGGRRRQDAERALGRDAQARRLRARARARPGHRALRRARLRASTRFAPRSCAS